MFTDPQLLHRQMLLEFDHLTLGRVKHCGIPIKLSETPGEVRRLAPLSGENTGEVLLAAGYSRSDIEQLRKAGAIG